MTFFLQQGYGMMGMNKELSEKIDNLGVILSPRALQKNSNIERIEQHAKELKHKNVKVLFDPQFYVPRTNLEKIIKFPYFNNLDYSTVEFSTGYAASFSRNVVNYQLEKLNVDEIIIPNIYTNSITEDWYSMLEYFIEGALAQSNNKIKYLSIPLGPDVIINDVAFDELISRLIQYEVDGYYFVFKSPKGFLIDDENYLYSLLDAFISLNLANKKVLIGYANQQNLIFGAAGVTSIASGNFRNVRSFDPVIFFDDDDNVDTRRRGKWYYDGNTMSEYKVQQLILAYRRDLKDHFGPSCQYCEHLLENPTTALWKESDAFKHYLFEINKQWTFIKQLKPSERIDRIINMLESVDEKINFFHEKGFGVGTRAFDRDVLESSINALYAIKSDRNFDIKQLKDL
ncbi:hypothetical protein MOD54_08520 [Bacillus spizizenii]|nr:hypothetical protein [Bacillus spizizenii]MCY8060446.1 hypothetical protein [Bacillus spizizenii]MCY8107310.1 hypothetical protein [Bacillus spizizenii]MCY8253679.1 hypothetical protein [Bacillus spizizenii]MCY8304915.1 hypothetical protein [Bacillus spizizenii]